MRFLTIFTILFFFSFQICAQDWGLGCIDPTPEELATMPMVELETSEYASLAAIEVDHSAKLPPVKSQGSQGSCVGWSAGYYLKTYQEKKEHGADWDATQLSGQCSPAFVYNHINGGNDNGSSISAALALLTRMGCPSWEDMPYTTSNYTNWPSQEIYEKGFSQRSDSYSMFYYGTASDAVVNNLINWVNAGHCFIISIKIYQNFYTEWTNKSPNDVYSTTSGSEVGSHGMCICGYSSSKKAFKVVNSWGTSWGASGYTWLHQNLFKTGVVTSAYKLVDKKAYTPRITARVSITHPMRGALGIDGGRGDHTTPDWTGTFFSYHGGANAITPVAVDLTDGLDKQDVSNIWWLKIRDYGSGSSGSITSVSYLLDGKTYTPGSLPLNLDSGATVYTDATIYLDDPDARKKIDKEMKNVAAGEAPDTLENLVDKYMGK